MIEQIEKEKEEQEKREKEKLDTEREMLEKTRSSGNKIPKPRKNLTKHNLNNSQKEIQKNLTRISDVDENISGGTSLKPAQKRSKMKRSSIVSKF